MPKTVVYDKIELDYARVEVREGKVTVLMHYAIVSSTTGDKIWKDADVSSLLTPEQQGVIVGMAQAVQKALEAQELQ